MITDSLLFKLAVVGLPLAIPFAIVLLLVLWKRKRGSAAFPLRTITALVTFELGILGSLVWFAVHDEAIDRANTLRYHETSSRIKVGMTKAEVIELAGSPSNMNLGKGGEEYWSWQSRHRWEHPIAYKVIGKSPYQGGPLLQVSFDSSERVATVQAHTASR